MTADSWDPAQYHRFERERTQPFLDLLQLVQDTRFRHAVDLGCGAGRLTTLAAERFEVDEMLGIDTSEKMLASAAELERPGLAFERGDLASWTGKSDHDLVLANASLHWVPDHAAVLARWTLALRPGGQLAVQVPANAYMPAHRVADELAHSAAFRAAFGPDGPPPDPVAENVLEPEQYAQVLFDLGYEHQHVRLQVYPHVLSSTAEIVEWIKGTSLTRFRDRLEPTVYDEFLAEYRRALLTELGDRSPVLFPFRRILFWAKLPNPGRT